jgi:hypothetical protein
MSQNKKVILCKNFDKKRFLVTDIDKENERVKGQYLAYPRYDYPGKGEGNLMFQTPEIKITQYGIPSLGEYYKDDTARTFVKVPFDPEQQGCTTFKTMLSQIDELAQDESFLKKVLGKNYKSWTYTSMVREPAEQEDDLSADSDEESEEEEEKKDTKKSDTVKFDYCKVKLDVNFGTGELATKFFVRDPAEAKVEGKKKRPEEVKCKTVTELEEYLKWGSSVKMMIMVNKFWAAKTKQNGVKSYGITMKAVQMEITPRESSGSLKEEFSKHAFISDEDESYEDDSEDDETLSSSSPSKKASAKNDLDGDASEESDEEEDEEDVEEDVEEDEEEDEDEEEEDEDEEDEEEDEEDEEDDEDEEEDEEEEEPEPAPKKVVKKVAKKSAKAPAKAKAKKSAAKSAKA